MRRRRQAAAKITAFERKVARETAERKAAAERAAARRRLPTSGISREAACEAAEQEGGSRARRR